MLVDDEKSERHRLQFWDQESLPTLNHTENLELLIKYKQTNDAKEKYKIRSKLIYGNLKLAKKILYELLIVDKQAKEDYLQDLVLYIIKAIDTFKFEKKAEFSTYLGIVIKGELRDRYARENTKKRKAKVQSLENYIGDQENIKLLDRMKERRYDENWTIDRAEINYIFENIIPKLSPKYQEVFKARYLQDLNQAEIAEKCGYKKSSVTHILKRAKDFIKEAYTNGFDTDKTSKNNNGTTTKSKEKTVSIKKIPERTKE